MMRRHVQHQEGRQDDRLELHFRWRVPMRKVILLNRGGWVGRTQGARAWCAEQFGTDQHDVFVHPKKSPAVWAYRYEINDMQNNAVIDYDDAFYFRNENDAFEFKMRWG